MARRGGYSGAYAKSQRAHSHRKQPPAPAMPTEPTVSDEFWTTAARYFWSAYSALTGSYLAVATLLILVVLGYIIPDISSKICASHELSDMKKVLSRIEVKTMRDLAVCTTRSLPTTQSEPVQIKKKVGFFRRILLPYRNTSHKEITIMSYLYTDSFDAKKENN